MYNKLLELQIKKHFGNPEYLPSEILPLLDIINQEYEKHRQQSEAEANLFALIENTQDIIWSVDSEYRIVTYNSAFTEVMKYFFGNPGNKGVNILNLVPPEDAMLWKQYYDKALGGERFSIEEECNLRDVRKYYEISFNPIISDGKITGVSVFKENITKRKVAELELVNSRNAAVEAAKAKSQFLSAASHEIRNTLNGILGMSGLLADSDLSGDQKEYVQEIQSGGNALMTVINDIMEYSKIEAGEFFHDDVPFNLEECIEAAFETVADKAAAKDIDLIYHIAENVPVHFVGDTNRVKQIIIKLADNGIRYSTGGEVFLTASLVSHKNENNVLLISIKDSGVGMRQEKIQSLFNGFTQKPLADSNTGSGMGMDMCSRMIKAMGGKIWVESAPGEGSTFYFTLKLQPVENTCVKNKTIPGLIGKKILFVDDNETSLKVMNMNFRQWGLIPYFTSSPEEALSLLNSEAEIDISMIDLVMPGMDGIKLGHEIRKLKRKEEHPVILVSNSPHTNIHSNLEKIFNSVVRKPVKRSALYEVLTQVLTGL